MKPLREALISKDTIKWVSKTVPNKYGITEKDMIDELKGFPVGVVIKMMEEQEKQGNEPDIKVFQKSPAINQYLGGFAWDKTEDEWHFWREVISRKNFSEFYKRYPEYKKYDE